MRVVTPLVRPLIAPIFVHSGITALKSPELLLEEAEPFGSKLAETVPMLPKDAATRIRINGAAQVAGGVLVGLGKFRRMGALILIGTLVPSTLAAHAFWDEEDPTTRAAQRIQFEKNLAIAGALLMTLTDRRAKPRARKRDRPAKVRVSRQAPAKSSE